MLVLPFDMPALVRNYFDAVIRKSIVQQEVKRFSCNFFIFFFICDSISTKQCFWKYAVGIGKVAFKPFPVYRAFMLVHLHQPVGKYFDVDLIVEIFHLSVEIIQSFDDKSHRSCRVHLFSLQHGFPE
ncbi:hypothetical protein D3C86_1574640 [compost metagenome]